MKKRLPQEIDGPRLRVDAAAQRAARRQLAEQDFLARGRMSLDNAKKTGEFYPLGAVLDEMQSRLAKRMADHACPRQVTAGKS